MRPTLVLLLLAAAPLLAHGQAPPSYARQIRPFFTRYCVECHNSKEPEGGLNLETYKALMEGGGRGAAVVAGKPDSGPLVRMIEGKHKPAMPPKKARQPAASEVALVRAWVKAGARDDSDAVRITLPAIAPRQKRATPVASLA
jgi:mono/diheme cytochrome c family protein